MSERKLATIQVITDIRPIDGADKIEVAQILGWECVIKKGEFKIGESVIYIEVDSVLPEKKEFEFLRERKFRIKTIKLRGQISQGLVLPIPNDWNFSVGTDVTDLMGIKKYLTVSESEEFETTTKKKKGRIFKYFMKYAWFRRMASNKNDKGWPNWVGKTDEERIQSIPGVLTKFAERQIYITEKIDYQSATFTGKLVSKFPMLGKLSPKVVKFVVCSRNMVNNDKNSLYWKIARKYNIAKIIKENPYLIIQGEQGNTKIQGNKYGIKTEEFWVFNIINSKNNYHYNYTEMCDFCNKNGLKMVPLLYSDIKISDIGTTVQDFIELSKGKSTLCDIQREGIVVRCIENGKKVFSFKVINPDFLLKYE